MADEALWRRRFQLYMAARLLGTLAFLAGIAVAYGDVVREGGWPAVGAVVAIAGVLGAVFGPRMLKRRWDREDRE